MIFYIILGIGVALGVVMLLIEERDDDKVAGFIGFVLLGSIVALVLGAVVSVFGTTIHQYDERSVKTVEYVRSLDKYLVTDDTGETYEVHRTILEEGINPVLKFYVNDNDNGVGLPWRLHMSEHEVVHVDPSDIIAR